MTSSLPRPPLPAPPAGGPQRRVSALLVGLAAFFIALLALALIGLATQDEDSADSADAVADRGSEGGLDCQAGDGVDDTRNLCLYPDRPDRRADDHEAEVGESVRLSGYTATLEDAEIERDGLIGDHLRVGVALANRDDHAQPYEAWQIGLQTADGVVLDPVLNPHEDRIPGGELIPGGEVEGSVVFDVGPGTYYLVFDPDLVGKARGIWRIDVD